MLVATALGAFSRRYWLYLETDTGAAHVTQERTTGGGRRVTEFDSLTLAREYFDTYTTPVTAIEPEGN